MNDEFDVRYLDTIYKRVGEEIELKELNLLNTMITALITVEQLKNNKTAPDGKIKIRGVERRIKQLTRIKPPEGTPEKKRGAFKI